MLIVLGKCIFRERIADATRAHLAELAREVRRHHTGNIDYRFSVDTEDPRVLRFTERWDRLESFVAHVRTTEVAASAEIVNSRDTESTDVHRYEVSSEVTL